MENPQDASTFGHRRRTRALIVLSMSSVLVSLDGTIVNVAIPAIRASLQLADSLLALVVSSYTISFGGLLLLGGRLGDFFGRRKMFLINVCVFSIASLCCGVSNSAVMLIGARAVQGGSAAIVSAVASSMILDLFSGTAERARAISILGFVSVGGSSLALLLGGVLTSFFGWHWIFLINIPIGAAVFISGLSLLPRQLTTCPWRTLDVAGALTATLGLLLTCYIVGNSGRNDQSLSTVCFQWLIVATLAATFIGIEKQALSPIVPLRILRFHKLSIACIATLLMGAAGATSYFVATLYLQTVIEYSPLQVGLIFLPSNLLTGALTLGMSGSIVRRFGIKRPLTVGLWFATIGAAVFALAPIHTMFMPNVIVSSLLWGAGSGIASTTLWLAATTGETGAESGLISGMFTTASTVGASVGLSLVSRITVDPNFVDVVRPSSFSFGGRYQAALWLATGLAFVAALISGAFLRREDVEPERFIGARGNPSALELDRHNTT